MQPEPTERSRDNEGLTLDLSTGSESFQRQECTLILLNLAVLSGMLVVELVFRAEKEMPSQLVLGLFAARFLMQTGEYVWLSSRTRPLPARWARYYGHASIMMHLIFAGTVSIASQAEDSHYSVLMILPIVAAAFRYPLSGTLVTACAAGFLSLLEVYTYYDRFTPESWSEYFEATAMGLLYIIVALVVWLLVNQLRREQFKLRATNAELQQTRDRLVQEETLSAIGRLSSAIAHEIRNPIAMIASSLAMATQDGTDAATRGELFQVATTEAKRLEAFTNDFLSYARVAPPRREQVTIESMLSYVLDVARARAVTKDIRIESQCTHDREVDVDPFQMHQLLLNLVTNAIDAAPEGTTVHLGCMDGNGQVTLYVENGGPAIESDKVDHIFEPFVTGKSHGTGLGLAIARKIARAHGGDLELAVNEPDRIRFAVHLYPAHNERGA